MVNGHEQMTRFTKAARTLMERGQVDASAGRFSRTLFMGATGSDLGAEAAARQSAAAQGWSLVTLRFGRTGRAKGPLSYSVALLVEGGASQIVHDCSLVLDADGSFVLVPRSATYHFAVRPNGLERRHGRPADAATGAVRAARALSDAAKHADPTSMFLEVHYLEDVA